VPGPHCWVKAVPFQQFMNLLQSVGCGASPVPPSMGQSVFIFSGSKGAGVCVAGWMVAGVGFSNRLSRTGRCSGVTMIKQTSLWHLSH
jgi:hypothetical protein